MTTKTYIMHEMEGRGYSRFDEIPEEMFDYLPENIEDDSDFDTIYNDGDNSPWYAKVC